MVCTVCTYCIFVVLKKRARSKSKEWVNLFIDAENEEKEMDFPQPILP